jgi:GH15 family glucan-1,4-alpha-glucosidase
MNNSETNVYLPIEDHGVIGNMHTIALVSLQGSIDYLPFMRIDSPSIFLRLLDRHKGGHFTIKPQGAFIKQNSTI